MRVFIKTSSMTDFVLLKKNLKKPVEGFKIVRMAILGDSATQLVAQAISTPKNEMVRDHYKYLGFEAASTENVWRLDVAKYETKNHYIMRIKS